MDGEITIGTKLSTDKFDKQIKNLEKKIKKEESTKDIKIKAVVETDRRLEEQKRKVDELKEKYNNLTQKIEHLNQVSSGKIKGSTQDWKQLENYSQLIAQQERMNNNISQAEQKQYNLNIQAEKAKIAYQQMKDNVAEYKQKIENVKIQKQVADVEKLKQGFNNVGSSIQSTVSKVAKLALGVLSVAGAYSALRRASSDLASYDQQYATNLEYIRYALTQMIAPVLQWIVKLAATLLGYINAIMQAWFGINLFSRGSAKNFQKMKAGAGGVAKAVKEIKKQLAGFDEINMLTAQSDSGAGGGGGAGGVSPDFDLSKFQGEVPDWLQWIIDHKDEILSTLAGIAGGLIAIKLGASGIQALGIGVMVAGIVYTIQSLLKYLKDPSWENFGKVIQGIGIAIVGLGILIGNVPLIVAGAIVLILGLLAKNWDKIREGFNKAIDWIKGLGDKAWQWFFSNIDTIKEKFGWLGLGIVSTFIMAFDWITKLVAGIVEVIRDLLDGLFKGTKQILDGIIQIFRGDFKSGIISILKGIANLIIGVLNGLISGINAIAYPIRALIAGIGSVMGKSWSISSVSIPKIPYLKTGGIINMPNKGTMLGSAIGGESGKERSITFN